MHLFQRLIDEADTVENLNQFLEDNIVAIYDFQGKHYSEIIQSRQLVEDFLISKGNLLAELNYSHAHNRSFLVILYDISERFGFQAIPRLDGVVQRHHLVLGARLEAANEYLLKRVRENRDLIDRFDVILSKLQFALQNEEDDEEKVVLTFLNYVSYVVRNNLPARFVTQLVDLIIKHRRDQTYSLLGLDVIQDLLKINLQDAASALDEIQSLIDNYLQREKPQYVARLGYLMEEGTEYSKALEDTEKTFETIRNVSVDLYSQSQATFDSLGKGVSVLLNENQLFGYMYSYGKMHNQKLLSALPLLPPQLFEDKINVIDWGCGQALATMSFFDYLIRNGYSTKIGEVVLIDPSALAIMRGALHVRIFNASVNITTINRGFDDVTDAEFIKDKRVAKLHFFSNILDVERFSLEHLINRVESNFAGVNYFVCASPSIGDERNGRLDAFENYFRGHQSYEHLGNIKSDAGTWLKTWTRYIRVFKANI